MKLVGIENYQGKQFSNSFEFDQQLFLKQPPRFNRCPLHSEENFMDECFNFVSSRVLSNLFERMDHIGMRRDIKEGIYLYGLFIEFGKSIDNYSNRKNWVRLAFRVGNTSSCYTEKPFVAT